MGPLTIPDATGAGTPLVADRLERLIRRTDWAATPLGPQAGWPQSLRTTVDIMLGARHAMCLAWGPDRTLLYNDAYAAFLGARHPVALGQPIDRVWAEIWPELEPLVASALDGRATWSEDLHLVMQRNGYPEDTWWTFGYSPMRDESGAIVGMLNIATDTTDKVLSEQRQAFHLALEAQLGEPVAPATMQAAAARLLGEHLGAQRAVYAEDAGDGEYCIVRTDYVDGLPSIVGRHRYADFGKRLPAGLRAGRPLIRSDIANDPDLSAANRAAYAAIGTAATITVPVVKDGRLRATLGVQYDHPHDFSDAEVALVIDVSERLWAALEWVHAEAALRESEARYRMLFEAVDVGFCVIDMKFDADGRAIDYRIEEANPAFEHQTGLRDSTGRWITELLPQLEPEWLERYGRVARTGEAVRFENGSAELGRFYDVHAFRIGGPERRRVAILFNDITSRRSAELGLRELNERLEALVADRTAELRRFRDIIEATGSPICAFDTKYRLTAFNTAHSDEFFRIFGHRVSVGEIFPDLFPPDQAPTMRAMMDRALAGERYSVVEEFGDPDLAKPYWEVNYTPLRDEQGCIVGAFHLASDITARLRAEAELAAAQDALRQSQKMEAMGSLTGGVAHDFNNLLTPIVGSLDLLQRKGIGGAREQRLIAGAIQSAERAKTLVQRLLAFARRQPLQPRAVDVGALVRGMADLVASTSGPQIRVSVEVAADLPAAVADFNQLEMAILNLAVNARDAMPEGGQLTIAAAVTTIGEPHRSGLPAGDYVCLSVADTGHGMDAETLRHAIEPFFSTKGVGKGTGLGLSMAHGLAAQLGGGLAIDSRPGGGTTVWLWLPATASDAPSPAVVERVAREQVGRVLVVDDEEVVRASTADMLTDLGYDVVEAASAEEALASLDDGLLPDMLVTDHLMPGMNGVELARAVRRRFPTIRILIVSGYAKVEGLAPDLPRLAKPFRQSDLAAALTGGAD